MGLTVLDQQEPIKVHLSLNVADLARSVAFYYQLFGIQPAKWHDDYAKFELDDPPLIFSLCHTLPVPAARSVTSACALPTRTLGKPSGSACPRPRASGRPRSPRHCLRLRPSRTSAGLADPDGNFWEIYYIEENVDPASLRPSRAREAGRPARGARRRLERSCGSTTSATRCRRGFRTTMPRWTKYV